MLLLLLLRKAPRSRGGAKMLHRPDHISWLCEECPCVLFFTEHSEFGNEKLQIHGAIQSQLQVLITEALDNRVEVGVRHQVHDEAHRSRRGESLTRPAEEHNAYRNSAPELHVVTKRVLNLSTETEL